MNDISDKKKIINCFVIMPFSNTNFERDGLNIKITGSEWEFIFNNWIKKAVESFSEVEIVCEKSSVKPGNFVNNIVHSLKSSEIVIADLTGQKPNVCYELGVRHGLKNGNILITQNGECFPSDLKSYYYFEYEYSSLNYEYETKFLHFQKKLHQQIKLIIHNDYSPDNPVSDLQMMSDVKSTPIYKKSNLSTKAFRDLLNISPNDFKGLEIAISFYKENFPWIYEYGKGIVKFLNADEPKEDKINMILDFLKKLESTFKNKELKEYYSTDFNFQMNFTKNYILLKNYLYRVIEDLKKNNQ